MEKHHLTRDEKREARLTRVIGGLMGRREFLLSITASGLFTVSTGHARPVVTNSDDAVRAAYWVIWGAAGMNFDDHTPTMGITDPLTGITDDGFDPGSGSNDDGNAVKQATARRWMVWRIRKVFRNRFGADGMNLTNWNADNDYVMLNAARLGRIAAALSANDTTTKTEIREAFKRVKRDPKRLQIGGSDLWCQ